MMSPSPLRQNSLRASFDRYLVRLKEIEQSCKILEQLVDNIPDRDYCAKVPKIIKLPEGHWYQEVDGISLASDRITVNVNSTTGEITFANSKGETLLKDTRTMLTPRTDEANKGKYKVAQTFILDKDEAVYGLGQLRDTSFFYKIPQNVPRDFSFILIFLTIRQVL